MSSKRGIHNPRLLLIGQTQIVPRAAASSSFWSGCLGGGWSKISGWFHAAGRRGYSSIQAIPAGVWEESTWPARSAASMNDVDAEEHRQNMADEERPWWVETVLGLVP